MRARGIKNPPSVADDRGEAEALLADLAPSRAASLDRPGRLAGAVVDRA